MYQQVKPKHIGLNIHFIDSRRLSRFGVSGVYLVIGNGLTLTETGKEVFHGNRLHKEG